MKRKNFEFPTAYTVLFLILILVTILTHIIPAGKYDRLSYQQDTKEFVIEKWQITRFRRVNRSTNFRYS